MKSLFALFFSAVLAASANAGTHVWSGAGSTPYWSNAANWSSGGVPSAAEAAPVKLVFPANATSRTSTPNISNLKVDAIEADLTNGSYLFPTAGIAVTLTGAAGDNFKLSGASGKVTWQAPLAVQATSRIHVTGFSAQLDFQGVVSGGGGLVKTGPGALHFSTGGAANTFTGTLRLEEGALVLDKIAGTPCFAGKLQMTGGDCNIYRSHQIPDSSAIELLGGILDVIPGVGVPNVAETLGNVTMGGEATIKAWANSTLTFGGSLSFVNDATTRPALVAANGGAFSFGGGTRTISLPHADSQLDIDAAIGDGPTATNLVKSGAGYLKLWKANTFSGTLEVKEGDLEINDASGLGSTAKGTTVREGTTLILNAPMTLPAAEVLTLEGHLDCRYATEVPGPVILGGSPSLDVSYSRALKLSGVLSGNPAQFLIRSGGQVEWNGSQANTYTGILKLEAGSRLSLGKSAGPAIPGPVELAGGTLTLDASHQIADGAPMWFSAAGTFDVNGKSESLLGIHGDATATLLLGDGALTFTGNGSSQLGSASKAVRIHGSPLSSIRKKGTGTWTVYRGDSPVSGDQSTALHVEAGRVVIQDHWQGAIFLTGGTLEGNAVTGPITNNGGTLNLTRLQSQGVTTPGTGGTLVCDIDSEVPGTGFGRLQVTGSVNLTGLNLNLTLNYQPLNNETFIIIENDGSDAITGTFNGLPEGAVIYAGGQPFKITYKGGSGGNDVLLLFQGIGAPGPQITSLQRQTDGYVRIDIAWLPGKKLALDRAYGADFTQWGIHEFVTLDGQGKATVYVQVFGSPKEFFRLRTNP